jgi:hypothetical protein
MKALKFRIAFEDFPEVIREIECHAGQTFEDLHLAILESVGFDSSQLASFYICNENWEKKIEITLIDMETDDSDMTPVMREVELQDYLLQKGQKLIYEYDFVLMWRFLIEVEDVKEADKSIDGYPKFIESIGEAPAQYETTEKYPEEITDEDTMLIRELELKNLDLFHGDEEDENEEGEDHFGSEWEDHGHDDHREEDYY